MKKIDSKEIPKTLDECCDFIDKLNLSDTEKWLKCNTNEAISTAHHIFGQWIRSNFGLWEKPPNELKKWFIDNYFLDHADDISSLILSYYHQKKNGLKPNLEPMVNRFHKYWEKYDPNYSLKLRTHKINRIK